MFRVGFHSHRFAPLAVLGAGFLVAACAADGNQGGAGPAKAVAGNASCQESRKELDRLDARGVPARIEAANQGKKLSASQKADVDHYNRLLAQYLGSRCHLQ